MQSAITVQLSLILSLSLSLTLSRSLSPSLFILTSCFVFFFFLMGREVEDKQSKVPCTWAGACAWLVLPLSPFFLCFLMLRPWQEADNSAASGRMIRDPQNRHGKHTGNIYWKFKEYQNLENTAASKKTRILNHLFLFLCLRKWWICLLDEASHLFPPAKRGNARHIFFFNGKAIRHRAARHAGRVRSNASCCEQSDCLFWKVTQPRGRF